MPDPNATSGADTPGDAVAPAPVGDRYTLGDEIARGGMGAVYRATDTTLGREVAVKVLQERFAPDSGTARRFADEARIAAQLQHPGIPPVHDYGTLPDGRPFLAMKLIKGDTLDDLLKQRRDPGDDRGRFVAAFEAVCQAVAYAHATGVIHRDLKPANVMVGKFGEVQVMDWGLAKVLGARGDADATDPDATTGGTEVRSLRDSDDQFTQAGSVLGTPAYMPPEQAVGAVAKVDARSDVFGLGAVLAVILTGKPPFTGSSAETTRVKAATGDVADCLARLDACGAESELVALCKRCLSPKAEDRPVNAGEVAAAVATFRHAAEARARQSELDRVKAEGEKATAEAMAAEGCKRRRVELGLAATVVLLLAGAGGVAVWRVSETAKRDADAVRLAGEEREREVKAAAEADRRGQAERERRVRATEAVASVLNQVKAALEAGDDARAAPLLDQADRRAADDAVVDHADRRAAYRRDLVMLHALNEVNDFRWTPLDTQAFPSADSIVEKWATAFAGYGVVPKTTPAADAAARVVASPIRAALLAGLDDWLARSESVAVRYILRAADPDPFRDEVRRLLSTGDKEAVATLAGRTEWAEQPSGLVLAYSNSPVVPAATSLELLRRIAVQRRTDFALFMKLCSISPPNAPEWAGERLRWAQAGLALRPENPAALANLGFVLRAQKDLDGAEAAFRETVRLHPKYALGHVNLGLVLEDRNDLDGAEAAFREAVRVQPTFARGLQRLGFFLRQRKDWGGAEAALREAVRIDPMNAAVHYELGSTLLDKRELDSAIAAYREAIRLDPKDANPHNGLGNALRRKGDLDGAVAAYREAIRLDPKDANPHNGLGVVFENRLELAEAEAAYREAVQLNPRFAYVHANLGDVSRKQGRHAEAVMAYQQALAIEPQNVYARQQLDYCQRVLRGEVPTAPPPRAVVRP